MGAMEPTDHFAGVYGAGVIESVSWQALDKSA
jgi:hypothetical protein